jgi:phage tail-like protein
VQQLATLERILRERLSAEDGVSIVRHVLGNPCHVEYVPEVRRLLEGRIIGVKIRPRGGTAPTVMELAPDGEDLRYLREGKAVTHCQLEARDLVSLLVATEGYGRFLPQLYNRGIQRETATGKPEADFLRRFLLVFQTLSHETETRIAYRAMIGDPVRMEPRFLPWLASWLDFTLDERIPVTRRRIFLRRAVELFKWRGTVHGIREMIKTLTGLEVDIMPRRGPQPMELGNCALSRPEEPEEAEASGGRGISLLPYVTHAGEHLLTSPRFAREEYFTIVLDHRDKLLGRYRDRLAELLEQVARVTQHERPAHLDFVICFKDEEVTHNGLVLTAPDALSPNSVLGRACLIP